jgi:hypothetical protein
MLYRHVPLALIANRLLRVRRGGLDIVFFGIRPVWQSGHVLFRGTDWHAVRLRNDREQGHIDDAAPSCGDASSRHPVRTTAERARGRMVFLHGRDLERRQIIRQLLQRTNRDEENAGQECVSIHSVADVA